MFDIKNYLVLSLALLVFSCTEDQSTTPMIVGTSITVTCNRDKWETFAVGEELVFSIVLNTDPSVGVNTFTIERAGNELFSKSDYTANIVEFSFTYKTTSDDLSLDEVPFTFTLIDKNNQIKVQELLVKVEVDLPVFIPQIRPNPGWDLMADVAVTEQDTVVADVFQYISGEGFDTKIWWKPLNDSEIYDVSNQEIPYLDINLSYSVLENAITRVDPVDSLFVGGQIFPIPLIVKVNRTNELVLIDFSNVQGSMVGYRKRKN